MSGLSLWCTCLVHLAMIHAAAWLPAKHLAHVRNFLRTAQQIPRCDIKRIATAILNRTLFVELVRRSQPFLVDDVFGDGFLKVLSKWHWAAQDIGELREKWGNQRVRFENGKNDNGYHVFYGELGDYLMTSRESSEHNVIDINLMSNLSATAWASFSRSSPTFFADITKRPILSIGLEASGQGFHKHGETWFFLARGKKAWWLTPNLDGLGQQNPCGWLGHKASSERARFCIQQPGELIFFPKDMYHATCNLAPLTIGIAAQERLPSQEARLLRQVARGDVKGVRASLRKNRSIETQLALQRAIRLSSISMVRTIMEHGMNAYETAAVEFFEGQLEQPMHAACRAGSVDVAEYLLYHGSEVHDHAIGEHGQHPIHVAASEGHVPVVDFLLGKGATAADVDGRGWQPLWYTISSGHSSMTRHLLQQRGSPTAQAMGGYLPIHFAAGQGHTAVIEALIRESADVRGKSANGWEAIHGASTAGHLPVVALLLDNVKSKNDADQILHAKMQDGLQPLHFACKEGHADLVEYIVSKGASLHAQDRFGKQPIHFAIFRGHVLVLDRLMQQGVSAKAAMKILKGEKVSLGKMYRPLARHLRSALRDDRAEL